MGLISELPIYLVSPFSVTALQALNFYSGGLSLLDRIVCSVSQMGDPLSISASIITILQLTSSIIQYFKDAKGAGEECRKALVEFAAIHGLLRLLNENLDRPFAHRNEEMLQSLRVPLKEFRVLTENLEAKVKPTTGMKKVGRALVWHFEKNEIKQLLSEIERYKLLFSLALQNDHMYISISSVFNLDISSGLSQVVQQDLHQVINKLHDLQLSQRCT